ncbi:MAG TPA: tRNA dihydrouridine(20/20a) synthase DusA [Rhodospirillaceae bacterium]|nr:MAG: tRNA dihydrouridine(20/20a) synthase DusA [Alphaproteobacteria bacterium GWF2_58_20]HAU29128.1 tRNA dihydrouridine(20/20a) synthase DusA [Rhodospirillaceae bacterium]
MRFVNPEPDRKLSIAPMLDITTRHFRRLARILAPHALLYTEMVPTPALAHGRPEGFLFHTLEEQPLALQIGGSDTRECALSARMAADAGFCEINLNCGCPSRRVHSGNFGACLMKDPNQVVDIIRAMKDAAPNLPATVKCRLGVDDHDTEEHLFSFIRTVADAGCNTFIIHARKAFLKNMSPAKNRTIPTLRRAAVYRVKDAFPELEIIINGDLRTAQDVMAQFPHVDGVMVGRVAYEAPMALAEMEHALFGTPLPASHKEVVATFLPYMEEEVATGTRLFDMARHLMGLYAGQPGARLFRQRIAATVQDHAITPKDILDACPPPHS